MYCGFWQQVISRIVDGSRFDEFKALYGETLVTGKAEFKDFFSFYAQGCETVIAC